MNTRYERTRGGVLVPVATLAAPQDSAASRSDKRPPVDPLTRWVNLLGLGIQALTVVVLWLTFQTTVIPTQQKELLAEQVSQLQIEKRQTIAAIQTAELRVKELDSTLADQRAELARLDVERAALIEESQRAHLSANSALEAAAIAGAKEKEAKRAEAAANAYLTDAGWRIFQEEVAFQIWRPVLKFRRRLREGASDGEEQGSTPEGKIVGAINGHAAGWPDFQAMVSETAAEISNMRSPHYTASMAQEFAEAFRKEGSEFTCLVPDFEEMKRKYLTDLRSSKEQYASVIVLAKLSKELIDAPQNCSDEFVKIGSRFLDERVKNKPQIPQDVLL